MTWAGAGLERRTEAETRSEIILFIVRRFYDLEARLR
jgi:hypothetical protein